MLTAEEIHLASMRAEGATLQTIANQEGKDISTISRRLNKAEVQEHIQRIKDELVNRSLVKSADNINHAIQSYTDKDSDAQLRDHGFKASQRVLESVGILPSHAPTINIAGDVQVTPIIAQIIQQFGRSLASSDDVIEAEPGNK